MVMVALDFSGSLNELKRPGLSLLLRMMGASFSLTLSTRIEEQYKWHNCSPAANPFEMPALIGPQADGSSFLGGMDRWWLLHQRSMPPVFCASDPWVARFWAKSVRETNCLLQTGEQRWQLQGSLFGLQAFLVPAKAGYLESEERQEE